MKGGLYIKDEYKSSSDAFKYFLENSEISYLSRGSFGIVLKCDLKKDSSIKSPYENLRKMYQGKEVHTIIVKLSLLHLNEDYEFGFETLKSGDVEHFNDEVKKQDEIFHKTIDKLDPICPSIIYSNYLNEKNMDEMRGLLQTINGNMQSDRSHGGAWIKTILASLLKSYKDIDDLISDAGKLYGRKKQILLEEIKALKGELYSFGLIGMEMMGNYKPLSNIIHDKTISDNDKQLYEDIARLRLIQMAVKTGYSHNDYHQNNILVDTTASGYYGKDISGHVILIDFGYTKKIPDDPLPSYNNETYISLVRFAYNTNRFYDILRFFYEDPVLKNKFPDKDITWTFANYPENYLWIMPRELSYKIPSPRHENEKDEEYKKRIDNVKQYNETLKKDFIQRIKTFDNRLLGFKKKYEQYEETIKNVTHKKMFKFGEMSGINGGKKMGVVVVGKKTVKLNWRKSRQSNKSRINKNKNKNKIK